MTTHYKEDGKLDYEKKFVKTDYGYNIRETSHGEYPHEHFGKGFWYEDKFETNFNYSVFNGVICESEIKKQNNKIIDFQTIFRDENENILIVENLDRYHYSEFIIINKYCTISRKTFDNSYQIQIEYYDYENDIRINHTIYQYKYATDNYFYINSKKVFWNQKFGREKITEIIFKDVVNKEVIIRFNINYQLILIEGDVFCAYKLFYNTCTRVLKTVYKDISQHTVIKNYTLKLKTIIYESENRFDDKIKTKKTTLVKTFDDKIISKTIEIDQNFKKETFYFPDGTKRQYVNGKLLPKNYSKKDENGNIIVQVSFDEMGKHEIYFQYDLHGNAIVKETFLNGNCIDFETIKIIY